MCDTTPTAEQELMEQFQEVVRQAEQPQLKTKDRRKLRRELERLSAQLQLNSKDRRRVSRAMQKLEAKTREEREEQTEQRKSQTQGEEEKVEEDDSALNKQKKPTPYVVFVGQLPFSCTQAQLAEHFQSLELEGSMQVRMLKSKEGKPRGMAFVEVETAQDLHKCLSLHHSILAGRVINVEKSAGGKAADKRKEKITQSRQQQNDKLNDIITSIIKEYEDKNVLIAGRLEEQVKEALYSFNPSTVNDVLQMYERLPKHDRHPRALRQIAMKMKLSGELPTTQELEMSTNRDGAFKRLKRGREGGEDEDQARGQGPEDDQPHKRSFSGDSARRGRGGGRGGRIQGGPPGRGGASSSIRGGRGRGERGRGDRGGARGGRNGSDRPRREDWANDSNDLMRIFPSLQGRGGARLRP